MSGKRSTHAMRTSLAREAGPVCPCSLHQRVQASLHRARRRARLRSDLGRLEERAIHDMGARRLDLETKAAKPFWRA